MAITGNTYLDEASAARSLNVSRRTLQRWRQDGHGPKYIRIGLRRIGYDTSNITAWADANSHESRAAEMAKQVVAH